MSDRKQCRAPNCGYDMPLSMQHCPHCGRPRLFPNVDQADLPDERAALDRRYRRAVSKAESRGAGPRVEAFERFVETARPVIAFSLSNVQRLADSDNQLAETFYMRGATNLEKGSHVLKGKAWDSIRPAAETALFGDEAKRLIHFAALSPDEQGVSNYGDCSITLRTELISHRTSLLEQNMLTFFKEQCADYWKTERIRPGYRATWEDRARLAVAKLADRVESATGDGQFPTILLTRGATTADDDFIELHILGNMTARTMEKVVLNRRPPNAKPSLLKALKHKLAGYNVSWLDRSTTP